MPNLIPATEDLLSGGWVNGQCTRVANVGSPPAFAGGSATNYDTLEDAESGVVDYQFLDITIPNNSSPYCCSIYVRKDAVSSRYPEIWLQLTGGTEVNAGLQFNTTDGSSVFSEIVADPVASGVEVVDATWYRVWFTCANNGSGNTNARITIYPAMTTTWGGSFGATATGLMGVWGINLTPTATLQPYEPDPDYDYELFIQGLTALTTPAREDLLVVVDDPSGTPITKKLTIANLATLAISDVVVQVKTVGSGTYTPTTGMQKVLGIAVGGGGAGAGGLATDSAGGGGGGGGTVIRLMTAAEIGASKAYVVGAGGTGGTSPTAGAATTLDAAGALMNAGGGGVGTAGATFSVIGVHVAGGTGGTASNGTLNIPGQPGGRGVIFDGTVGAGGEGGHSVFGHGAAHGGTGLAGVNGTAYGGGGSGGHAATAGDRVGGNGADGILFLLEFLG